MNKNLKFAKIFLTSTKNVSNYSLKSSKLTELLQEVDHVGKSEDQKVPTKTLQKKKPRNNLQRHHV